jgi:predicted DNA-binding transcriptional regulator
VVKKEMSKDQAIGGAILVVCVLVAAIYALVVVFPGSVIYLLNLSMSGTTLRLYAVLVPVFIAFIAILTIGAWIGWTMATTPAPKPIEEITTESETISKTTPT